MFKSTLILWLAGFGMDEESCAKVCEDRRMARNITARDNGGVIQDLPEVLFRLGDVGREAYKALNDPGEKLMLMMALK